MFVIVDPSLRSYMGHFLTYDSVIADELKKRGQECAVLASNFVLGSCQKDLNIVPCFRYGLEGSSISGSSLEESFIEDLNKGAENVCGAKDATYFLHTCTPAQIRPAVNFIAQKGYKNAKLIIMLRYSTVINDLNPQMSLFKAYKNALSFVEESGARDRVFLTTDSDILAGEYRNITSMDITVLPIPHVGLENLSPPAVPTLTYLGNARGSKGFQYLPYVASSIKDELDSGAWRAEFQANVMFKRDTESVAAVARLRNLPVRLFEDELSIEEYQNMLARSSLVIIPYQTLWYYSQTSGVFAEAAGAGKPTIVPRGSWMGYHLKNRAAGVLFAPGDRVDLARATKEAMARIDELTQGALELREEWVRVHNPASFVNKLVSLGE